MNQYLYGASIQGIQQFIFSTNKLTEISGASEIVEYICTDFLRKRLHDLGVLDENNILLSAAGNIKCLFKERATCQKFVYDFPRLVMEMTPGITVSQAVVELKEEFNQEHIQMLEGKLRVQRNRQLVQHGLGLMISERSRRSGKPGVGWRKEIVIDASQLAKGEFTHDSNIRLLKKLVPDTKGRGYHTTFPLEMGEIAGGNDKKNWVAVIHADGNDLGKKIMKTAEENLPRNTYSNLSRRIANATEQAARKAFDQTVKLKTPDGNKFPFRPIILGGDDLTVIVRGDLAADFTHAYLIAFEEETKKELADFVSPHFNGGLTACAGIAYIKMNYPFHYGVRMAEELCAAAKKVSKSMNLANTPSCLLFHKVHSSFIENYDNVIKQELIAQSVRLDFGPYFLNKYDTYATVDQLLYWVKTLNEKTSPKSRLRNWLTELMVNQHAADQEMKRIKEITNVRYVQRLGLKDDVFTFRDKIKHTHLFDALTLSSIETNRQ